MLLSHRIPGPGEANTEFADTRRAWKDLPEEKKAELRDLISEHEWVLPLTLMGTAAC